MKIFVKLKLVECAVWAALFLLGIASILLLISAAFLLSPEPVGEYRLSPKVFPLADHSAVKREEVLTEK